MTAKIQTITNRQGVAISGPAQIYVISDGRRGETRLRIVAAPDVKIEKLLEPVAVDEPPSEERECC